MTSHRPRPEGPPADGRAVPPERVRYVPSYDPVAERARQATMNRATAPNRASYERHRIRLHGLVVAARRQDRERLCVLGAGNCNDLQLGDLAALFALVTLVDLDSEALERAIAGQGMTGAARIRTVAGVDLSGMTAVLAAVLELPAALGEPDPDDQLLPPELDRAAYDIVLSACMFTQIVDAAVAALGIDHPQLLATVLALRARHLAVMKSLLVAGGRGIFACDVVSSDTSPELLVVGDDAVPTLVARNFREGNFFTGTNPEAIRRALSSDRDLDAGQLSTVGPWRWHVDTRRAYAVYATCFRRRA